MSLRWKIVLTVVACTVIAVLSSGLILRSYVASAEYERLRTSTADQLASAAAIYAETGMLTLNASIDDPELPPALAEAAQTGTAVTQITGSGDDEWVWAASRVAVGSHEGIMSVRLDTSESQDLLARLDRGLLIGMLVPGALLTLLASLIADRMTRRLSQGAAAARRIAQGDSSVKVSEAITYRNDEVSDFALAVDRAVDRLQQRITSEQRFTSDLAHELRTPLTGLINAAALLDDSRPAELVRDRVQRLQTLVEDLLEVSRLEGGKVELQLSRVVLDQTVHSLVQRLQANTILGEHEVRVMPGAPGVAMETDLRRLERILTNVLINAAKHGADPIEVTTSPEAITITDHGPGYPDDILSHGPSRYLSAGAGGMGLGLVIAEGQARALGMQLRVGRAAGGGARTDIVLPAQFVARV
ncbi:sensor histidine kinase [Sediminivirga luteola]|uniref:Signal transduction histidine-protein kinase/phosphatase MprB n=1 Tax=Sediminivirga luteola TaxID=1774748 RepID=A0A8J2U0K7_9MICO|nr:HAMP domain-containing sensor histidine kinase [Sediminivirga luteola]MCI2264542.1 HAMP domain-containing histidine kinase [Sediminivirga luteola]GGA25965.1 sensor protein CseC [Sediminivirga luteola]